MNYLNELFKLPNHLKNQIRKLENVKTKLLKSKWSLVFNDTCLKENLLPDYTHFREQEIYIKIVHEQDLISRAKPGGSPSK